MISPLLLLGALALSGCRTVDTDVPIDETGDAEDCPGCFDVQAFLWDVRTGLQGGAFATVHTTTGDRIPELDVLLVEREYFENETPDPERSCVLRYTLGMAPGTTAPSAWLDWSLIPTLASDECGELDPDWVAPSFAADLAAYPWELVGAEVQGNLLTWIQDGFEDAGNDWATDGEPYYFGVTALLDSHDIGAGQQANYGRAYAVDADMNIVAEATGGSLLTTGQVAAGLDGYYELYGWRFFDPREDLQ